MDPASLTAVAVFISLNWLPGFGPKKADPRQTAAVTDTIPPTWRPVSRLVLENDFVVAKLPEIVRERSGFKVPADPRTLRVSVDAETGTLSAGALVNTVPVGPPVRLGLDQYATSLSQRNFQRIWQQRSIESINAKSLDGIPGTSGGGLSFKLPSPLPRRVQSLLGPGGPAINVSGSENIKLSGQSNWSNQELLDQKRSLFPSLDMQQDLDIRLEGQLSDRIKVNLLQNSANQVPLANRIFINYRGDEDDLVQALDLGNTSLSLPGTQYVSYSGKNEGLFGVKTALRLGPADFTMLASKQEGRSERASYAGGASREAKSIGDYDYIKGVYFFLFDPNRTPAWFPDAYRNRTDITIEIPENTVRLYLDDDLATNDLNVVPGRAYLDPELRGCGVAETTHVRGTFTQLNAGADQDFEILRDVYGPAYKVIRLRRQVTGDMRLAVSYKAQIKTLSGAVLEEFTIGGQREPDSVGCVQIDTTTSYRFKLLRAPDEVMSAMPRPDIYLGQATQFYDTANPFTAVRELELRNFYQLPGQRIDATSFNMAIRRENDDPPLIAITRPDGSVPYIEVGGLDSFDEGGGSPAPGHDSRVDGSVILQNGRTLIDFEDGILFFPDLRPFAPRIGGSELGSFFFDQAISDSLLRRDAFVGHPDSLNGANRAIYDAYNPIRGTVTRYFIDVEFSAARTVGEISLGRGNILEGSEVVTINGQALVRDRDYTVDYDIGRLTLKRQLGPTDNLNINYSYAPLFAQAGRTLLGGDFRIEGREKRLGGALLYESRGAQDLRPRIGEEPSRTVIGDLNTEWTFHPDWMTRLVDRLPGVRTTTPSDFHFQAEMGTSFPNPNTKNVVYLDDMESVRDATSLSMVAERWKHSSVPSVISGGAATPINSIPNQHNTEIQWYSPPTAIKERELNPALTEAQGANNSRQVLAISLPRRPTTGSDADDELWAGLQYQLDPQGIDLSRAQFIEVWVNDFNDHHVTRYPAPRVRGQHVKLHIDLGVVSEDQQRSPDVPPNSGLPDSEDNPPPDNQLSVSDNRYEDTGVDRQRSVGGTDEDQRENVDKATSAGVPAETVTRDLTTADSNDPQGDDFRKINENYRNPIDSRRFFKTNGTEGNRNLIPYPDTEDLDLNGNLDQTERYYEYTIDLGDPASPYLLLDVRETFPGSVDILNGWRRYRIPIGDSLRQQVSTPDLTRARHVRVWLEDVMLTDPADNADSLDDVALFNEDQRPAPRRPFLMLGGLEIVGSRWQATELDSLTEEAGATFTLNAVNNIDDPSIYTPPFDPGDALSGNRSSTRREQSLVLEFEQLPPDGSVEAYKTFSIDENYSRYGALTWYTRGVGFASSDTLYYFVRFASDELGRNYYEFKRPLVLGGFESVELKLTDLSNLKLQPDFPLLDPIHYVVPGPRPGDSLIVHGRPSFTRLRRISVGVENAAGAPVTFGQLWFNELRATDVAKDVGTAGRLQVDGRLANLLRYNLNYNTRDADFVTVGETRGTGSGTSQLGASGGIDLNRFFEGTGILLPVNGSFNRNVSRPRFSAGDDVVRPGALQEASETRSESRSLSTSYSRAWSERSNPFLRYTLGGITANYTYSESDSRNPTSLQSSVSRSAAVNYSVAPRNLLRVGVPFTRLALYPLPERLFWNYVMNSSGGQTFDRQRSGSLVPRTPTASRAATIMFGADTRPIDLLHHHFDVVRNLSLPVPLLERVGFINFGRVTQWKQSFDSRYTLNRGIWLSPGFNWNSNYSQDNRPDLSPDLSVRSVINGQTMGLNWTLPFDKLALPRRAPSDTTKRAPGGITTLARSTLSRLGAISADATYSQSSSYSRLVGTPDLLYLIGVKSKPGFSNEPGEGVQATFGNSASRSEDFRTSGRTRLALGFDAFLSTRAEYSRRNTLVNAVANRTVSSRFPDVDFEYGRIAQVIRLDKIMNNPVLRTSYSRSTQSEYRNDEPNPSLRSTSSQWQPLIGLSGMLKNQTRTELRIERRVSQRENFQLTTSVTTDRNTDVNFNMSRSYSKGSKVSLLGKETTVRSNVNLQLAIAYSKQSGETRQLGVAQPQLPQNKDRLSVNGSGSYSFSNNVTGNLGLGFGQQRDIERDQVSRNIRLELRASFTF